MHVDTQLEAALRALDHWPRFRLRLFFEGILVGILSGTVISFFRWGLEMGTVWRQWIYANVLASGGILLNLGWFAVLLAAALLLWRLGVYEPNAGGSGIPQVKGVILGAIRMRWLRILWVKLVGGIVGIAEDCHCRPEHARVHHHDSLLKLRCVHVSSSFIQKYNEPTRQM